MGIIEVIKRMSENKSEMKERFSEMQKQDKLETMLEERKKSSNRRELERYMKEKEEEDIKKELEKIRKQKTREMWTNSSILAGGTSILRQDKNILTNDRPILKQKNIFKTKQKENQFFK